MGKPVLFFNFLHTISLLCIYRKCDIIYQRRDFYGKSRFQILLFSFVFLTNFSKNYLTSIEEASLTYNIKRALLGYLLK